MKLSFHRATVDVQCDRDHVRLFVELTHDAGMTVLNKRTNWLGGIHNFESIQRRRQRSQHLRLGHGQSNLTKLQKRMTACEQMIRIHVGHGAGSGDIHITTGEDGADSGAGFQRFRLFHIADGASTHHGNNSSASKLWSKLLQGLFGESAEHEWRFNGLQIIRRISQSTAGATGRRCLAGRNRFGGYSSVCRSLVQSVDLEHLANRSYAGNWLFGKCSDAEGKRSGKFSVQVNRAAAHAGDDAGVLRFFTD